MPAITYYFVVTQIYTQCVWAFVNQLVVAQRYKGYASA